jgi:hypothetical protein
MTLLDDAVRRAGQNLRRGDGGVPRPALVAGAESVATPLGSSWPALLVR